MTNIIIVGCGDIGRRIGKYYLESGNTVIAISQSKSSKQLNSELEFNTYTLDFDKTLAEPTSLFSNTELHYLVPPQKNGISDTRSQNFLNWISSTDSIPKKVVLISTTGVYGDCDGAWVTEQTPVNPQTDRAKRRMDAEQQWQKWGIKYKVPIVTLRVPGIYANGRLPYERLKRGTPVVNASECGFTNRIHAEDLARICIRAMEKAASGKLYNVTDGNPGKITEYLLAASQALGLPQPPIISMQQAKQQLSAGMLSYLSESRRINNKLMLDELNIKLLYPDFKKGLLV